MTGPILHQNKIAVKSLLAAAAVLFLLMFPGVSSSINTGLNQAYSSVHGQSQPDTNIVLITITRDDIDKVGPWPLKRSYYALLIKSLTDLNVQKIGLEVFLSARFTTQTIYDNLLAKEIKQSGRVVLGSVAGALNEKDGKYFTDSLSYPSPKLLDETAATGHLNYIDGSGIKIPLRIYHEGNPEDAFSLKLSGIDADASLSNPLRVNFVSSWKKFKRYGLLEFFSMLHNNDAKLKNLKSKTVIIGITDPGIAASVRSVFDSAIPGAALHAFALDNILMKRGLNFSLNPWSKIAFIISIIFLLFYESVKKHGKIFITYSYALLIFFVISFILYSYANLTLAGSFFILPVLLINAAELIFDLTERNRRFAGALDEAAVLKNMLHAKESELSRLQSELDLSSSSGSGNILDKIKSLKSDIEKLKESEDDKKIAEEIASNEITEFHGIVYRSKAMEKVIDLIKKAAPENANIIILGESGTGKELVANAVHKLSKRRENNFVAVNCGALPDSLLESELFGHVKGAFTGAVADKIGRFESADKGTIFLDEIAETSEAFQVKLLRIIQSGDFEKVGSSKTSHTDVRIVAATNKNLEQAVKEKKFREDLYYRLNVIKIELPPLRERKEDIDVIAAHFLKKEGEGIKLSKAAAETLTKYDWKGNVRELEAVIKRAVIFAKSSGRNMIQLSDLPEEIVKDVKMNFEDLVIESLRGKEFSHSSIIETAKELGNVSRTVVSENFRGYALKIFVESNFDLDSAASKIADSREDEILERVKNKLNTFTGNVGKDVEGITERDFESVKSKFASKYKNLPHKFHPYLDEVVKHILKR